MQPITEEFRPIVQVLAQVPAIHPLDLSRVVRFASVTASDTHLTDALWWRAIIHDDGDLERLAIADAIGV